MTEKKNKKGCFIKDANGEIRVSSISPRSWGSLYWEAMFMRAGRYPINDPTQEDKASAKGFYTSLATELPCSLCRISYKELLCRFPIDNYLDSRKQLISYVWLIRDQVNRKLIIQEREEYRKVLKELPQHVTNRKEIASKKLYTKPSPNLNVVLKKWWS
jgi:hypothetical protein